MKSKRFIPWIWEQSDWPKFTWNSAALTAPLATARRVQGEIAGVAKLLDPSSDLHAQLEVLTTEGVATSAVEGETFDPDALRSSLAHRLGLTAEGLPTPPRFIEGLVDVLLDASSRYQFLAWFNAPPAGLDGLLRAGVAHAWFEIIHPFADGNGRVGRALLDRALAQDEQRSVRLYSISAPIMNVRDEYYQALEKLSRGDLDVTTWLLWFLEQVTVAGRGSEQIIRHVLRKARFWIQHSQQPLNDRQRKALNAMLDAAPPGYVGGMTNRKYAHLTRSSAPTAQRDLAQLVTIGCLVSAGAGRSARYDLRATDT